MAEDNYIWVKAGPKAGNRVALREFAPEHPHAEGETEGEAFVHVGNGAQQVGETAAVQHAIASGLLVRTTAPSRKELKRREDLVAGARAQAEADAKAQAALIAAREAAEAANDEDNDEDDADDDNDLLPPPSNGNAATPPKTPKTPKTPTPPVES